MFSFLASYIGVCVLSPKGNEKQLEFSTKREGYGGLGDGGDER
jgi:hypothetical protein